jgi:CRISPR type III-A-associated RAMP protein Csm4
VILYRLLFEGPLRVPSNGDLFPRSDTLAGALCAALASLGEDAARAAERPGFALSSAFPFALGERGEPCYFLPRPLASRLDGPLSAELRAVAGRVRYLSPSFFAWALAGEGEPEKPPFVAQEGAVWSESAVPARLWSVHEEMHRPLDRQSGAPAGPPWRTRTVSFAPGAGLCVFARYIDRNARARTEAALRLLADEGIGRQSPFRLEVDEGFRIQAGHGGWVLLSLYHPTQDEVERGVLRGARYALLTRGGTHSSGARRRPVRMVAEGARLADVGGAPQGTAVRVLAAGEAPGLSYDVHRSGLAVCLPAPRVAS